MDMPDTRPTPDKPSGLLDEVVEFRRSMPDKALFLSLLAVLIVFFRLLGNCTVGYTDSASLFASLHYAYLNSEDDQHGFLVPFVDLVLMYVKRQQLRSLHKSHWWPALALVVAGLLL